MRVFENSRFTVCDSNGGELRLFAAARDQAPLRSFNDVAKQVDTGRIAFAMNAGMFGEDGRPIGLAIVDGRQVHALNRRNGGGNFHLMPNGVFLVKKDGSAAVVTSDRYAALKLQPRFASQSGPMLVIDGKLHPRFDEDGTSRLSRNGVGVTRDGHALFVIADDPVSFGKMARFFRDALRTPNALYFDGAVSSLWDPPNGRQDSFTELGPIIVAFKPAASAPGRAGRARS
jgi:uncharacterized protein YigE (DUF2233 family)